MIYATKFDAAYCTQGDLCGAYLLAGNHEARMTTGKLWLEVSFKPSRNLVLIVSHKLSRDGRS